MTKKNKIYDESNLHTIPNGGFVPLKKINKIIKSFNTKVKKNNILDIFNKKQENFIDNKNDLIVIDEL
jgi:hypothetical protein